MRYSCSLGRYFGNWLSDRRPLAHSICSPQARLLAAPNRSFLTCHTGAILLLSPLLLITILPNDRHFLWGSKMAPSVLNLSKLWPKPRTPVPIVVCYPPLPAQIFPIASRIPYHHILNMTPTSIRRLKVPLSCKTPPPRRSIPIKRDTYKFQSYGDYFRTIRIYGTTDFITQGPSEDAFSRGHVLRTDAGNLFDDSLSDDECGLICGVYELETGMFFNL